MKRYAVIRDYGNDEEQVTFHEDPSMFSVNQKHVEMGKDETATAVRFEKKYGIKLEYREAKPKTHWGWFVKTKEMVPK